MRKAW